MAPLQSGFLSDVSYGIVALGLLLVVAAVFGAFKRVRGEGDEVAVGPFRFWSSILLVLVLGCAITYAPYAGTSARSIAVSAERIELHYLWPRPPIVIAGAHITVVRVRGWCSYARRRGWTASYSLGFDLADGRSVPTLSVDGSVVARAAHLLADSHQASITVERRTGFVDTRCHLSALWSL